MTKRSSDPGCITVYTKTCGRREVWTMTFNDRSHTAASWARACSRYAPVEINVQCSAAGAMWEGADRGERRAAVSTSYLALATCYYLQSLHLHHQLARIDTAVDRWETGSESGHCIASAHDEASIFQYSRNRVHGTGALCAVGMYQPLVIESIAFSCSGVCVHSCPTGNN
ncbi:hypothetical protein COCSADRAFT_302517 [Bipolaris sorokiniana ND90Pr]|uniref:Uncharacterized protein n=1 Tax=Cochliobolus sativus (strain ND90Pr / ATCC 201652) TaxID=665912 RepID=M2SHV4_COCSN|nr:uncharacterized protein COCSADRAFT_302517 [Bipolaris sorokiniana ND90Pr]EMD66798.1 hypothetical protein COCSADRAFT_302517 [Bipolaris sorokiniana ND90Pr]